MKQRIIGALVLVSLAVIFVPMMFDEPHDEGTVRTLDIPEEPPFPEVSVPEDENQPKGVPDYRVEEIEPPTPEVVEDPPMGTQPTTEPVEEAAPVNEESPPVDEQVPLVGEEPEPASEQEVDRAAGDDEPGVDTESQPAGQPDSSDGAVAGGDDSADENADFQRTLEGAWVLQLGSFGDEANARRLRNNVRERGYGAHLQEVMRGDQRLVRVFAGPFADKSEAGDAKAILDEAFGVQALITRGEG